MPVIEGQLVFVEGQLDAAVLGKLLGTQVTQSGKRFIVPQDCSCDAIEKWLIDATSAFYQQVSDTLKEEAIKQEYWHYVNLFDPSFCSRSHALRGNEKMSSQSVGTRKCR
jgi:hypothetical protein